MNGSPNIALGLRLILEAADQVKGYTRPGRGIARARQVEAARGAGDWIRTLPENADAVDLPDLCAVVPEPATLRGMPKSPIQVQVMSANVVRIVRPGARYAVNRSGEEYQGRWALEGAPLDRHTSDRFTEDEARLLLPFLRVRGTAGRRGADPTTPDGKLVARACKKLGVTAAGLGERIGAHESVLSRARHGELTEAHRLAIKALLDASKKRAVRTR